MNLQVFCYLRREFAGHGYATIGLAQHEQCQMIEGAAKPGAPQAAS
jgi:hypothetical protein